MKISIAILALLGFSQAAPNLKDPMIMLDPLPPATSLYDFAGLKPLNVYVEPKNPVNASQDTRIIGGTEVTPNSIVYQAAAIIDGSGFCGGSLISTRWVLCAAHCTTGARSIQIILGAHRVSSSESTQVSVAASGLINHSGYNPNTVANDIALINLQRAVSTSSVIGTVGLAPASSGTFEGSSALLTGWGKTSDSATSISSTLQRINLPVISNSACANVFGSIVTSGHVCTSGSGNKGACNGDSGGPLVVSGAQIGIVSFGSSRCSSGSPSAFTRVSAYRSWISSNSGV